MQLTAGKHFVFKTLAPMWAAHDVASEIKAVSLVVKARRESLGNACLEVQQEKENEMVQNAVRKVEAMNGLDNAGGALLFEAIAEVDLSPSHKDSLRAAVDLALAKEKPLQTACQMRPQTLTAISKYFTASEWEKLEGKDTMLIEKANVICLRLKKLGIKSLAEATTKYAVALILVCMPSEEFPGYGKIYQLVQDFKKAFQLTQQPESSKNIPWMKEYPSKPDALPQSHFEVAYPTEPPVDKHFDRLEGIACGHVPLRVTSKLLPANLKQRSYGEETSCKPESQPSSSGPSNPNMQWMQMPPMNMQMPPMNWMMMQPMMRQFFGGTPMDWQMQMMQAQGWQPPAQAKAKALPCTLA